MRQKFLKRYLILITMLLICAILVWRWSGHSEYPAANAVLASASGGNGI